jgi:hypothetical protein
MNQQAVKDDFESMMRTFSCAIVSVRHDARIFDGLLPFVSTERRLMMQGSDPSWSGTLYMRRSDAGLKPLVSGMVIGVKRPNEPGYTDYKVGSPSDYAESFIAINLESKHRG